MEPENPKCCVSDMPIHRFYRGEYYHKDVMELAKKFRDAKTIKFGTLKRKPSLDGIYSAMREMKKIGKSWESIKFNLEKRIEENNSIIIRD